MGDGLSFASASCIATGTCLVHSGETTSDDEAGDDGSSICDFEGEPFTADDKQVAAASRQLMAVVVDIIKNLSRQLLLGERKAGMNVVPNELNVHAGLLGCGHTLSLMACCLVVNLVGNKYRMVQGERSCNKCELD